MEEKKKVVVEGTVLDSGLSPKVPNKPEVKVVKTPVEKKDAPKVSETVGRSLYSSLGFTKLLEEVKVRGLEEQAKGLTDSEKGRRELRSIIRKDDEAKGEKPHLTETTKTGKLPSWLIPVSIVAIVVLLAFIFWYRPIAAAPVDMTSVQASINQVSTKLDAVGKDITDLKDRVTDLESVPAKEPKAPTAPAEQPRVEMPVVADQVFSFNGSVPAYSDFRAAVNQPGEAAVFVWNFTVPLENAVVVRVWPDDTLVSAKLLVPGQDPKDLTILFGMFFVPKGGTGDATLDTVLQERGVNVVEGEILMQNKFSVNLGNVPAGSKIVFEIKDNEELAVNRGIGVVIDTLVDAFTVDVK